jgi:hypothetical protein
MLTTNYGLAGGQLNPEPHITAALPRLLTTIEQAEYHAAMRQGIIPQAVASAPGKAQAHRN